jgi:hypothetical protein
MQADMDHADKVTMNCRLISEEMKMNSASQQTGLRIRVFIVFRRMRCTVAVSFPVFYSGDRRIMMGNKAFHANATLFKSKLISKNGKL